MSKINKTPIETRLAIERRSAAMLPDRPTQAGYKPWDIRKALFSAIIADKGASIMGEIDRIVDETNAAIDALKEKIATAGTITIPVSEWDALMPTKAYVTIKGGEALTRGGLLIVMPGDTATKDECERARVRIDIDLITDQQPPLVDQIVFIRAAERPASPLNFKYFVLKTEAQQGAVVALIGVDSYSESGGTASGVDEEAVKALIGKEVPEWARAKQKPTYTPEEVKARPATWTPTAEEIGARPSTWMPTAEEVGADSAAAEKVQNHNEDSGSHTDIRVDITTIRNILAGVIGTDTGKSMRAVAALVVAEIVGDASDSFDTLEEIAAWIEAHPNDVAAMVKRITDLETAMGGKVSKTDIINTLDSTALDKPLSAAMGARLKTLLEEMSDELDGKTTPEQVTAQIKTALTPYIPKEEADKTYQAAGDYASGDHNHDGTYAKPSDIPTVPTKVSQLTNDSGYLNQHQSIAHLLPKNQGVANAGKLMMVAADGSVTYIDIADLGLSGGDVTGVMSEGNYIDLTGNLPSGTYSLRWTDPEGNTYNAGALTVGKMFTVTANVTNCTVSNTESVLEGNSYSATVSVSSGHVLSSITVTMGGVDITSSAVNGNTISISEVTGNIVITAVAEVEQANYTNLSDPTSSDWLEGQRLSSGGTTPESGMISTNYIDCKQGDVIRVKGLDVTKARTALYTSKTATPSSCSTPTFPKENANAFDTAMEGTDVYTFTVRLSTAKFIRFSGKLVGTANDVIITKNEPIE